MSSPRWLLFIHSIPPVPAYFRVKIGRRLRKLGAIALKNSVYLLENTEEAAEDLRWLAQEIRAGGGEAIIATSDVVDGPSDVELAARLRGARQASPRPGAIELASLGEIRGRRWVTRRGIKVDRMASAWLIRTRIDPEASFRFSADDAPPQLGDLRFDMFEGEFTHDGERCTFEVLVDRFNLGSDAALLALGEVVHDLDCKDDRYRRPATAGVAMLVDEITRRLASDEDRLQAGLELFASLHRALRGGGV